MRHPCSAVFARVYVNFLCECGIMRKAFLFFVFVGIVRLRNNSQIRRKRYKARVVHKDKYNFALHDWGVLCDAF